MHVQMEKKHEQREGHSIVSNEAHVILKFPQVFCESNFVKQFFFIHFTYPPK